MEMLWLKIFVNMKNQNTKMNKLKFNINFLNNCKQLGVYLKFLIFKLKNVSNEDASSNRKRILHIAIDKRNKEELQCISKELFI